MALRIRTCMLAPGLVVWLTLAAGSAALGQTADAAAADIAPRVAPRPPSRPPELRLGAPETGVTPGVQPADYARVMQTLRSVHACWERPGDGAPDVTVIFGLDPQGRFIPDSLRLVSFLAADFREDEAVTADKVPQALEAVRAALVRCTAGGLDLPSEHYALWELPQMTFGAPRMLATTPEPKPMPLPVPVPVPLTLPAPVPAPADSADIARKLHRIAECWLLPTTESPGSTVPSVTVRFSLDVDGQMVDETLVLVVADPADSPYVTPAFDAVRRAILRCTAQGLDLPRAFHASWRDVELTFDPGAIRIR